ncbi:MAG: hypothetical protein HKN33_13030 [Pyrinomonadaceae bacterium]|nr:hypothetical protein [Pyrinomonadaceae bacterium]
MDHLDELFSKDLDTAIERAKEAGRFDIADYLSLRASNDSIREEAVKWLFDTVLDVVFAFNRHGARIKIEQTAKHRIKYGASQLSGEKLELRQGLRCLTIEAGWTRSTGDGVMRGGSLAFSRISHFGFRKETEELELIRFENVPQWFLIEDEKRRVSFNVSSLKKHFEVFLG